MARWTAKEIFFNISSSKEAIVFLEAIQKQIKIVDIIADYFPGKVSIRFEGTKENLKEAVDIARNIHHLLREMLYPDLQGNYSYNLEFLTKITGKTVPTKTLLRIIKLKKYDLTQKNNTVISTIDFNLISSLITSIDTLLSQMPYEVATSSLRDVLTTLALVEETPVSSVIKNAKKVKIIQEDELNNLNLVCEPEQAIERYLKKI